MRAAGALQLALIAALGACGGSATPADGGAAARDEAGRPLPDRALPAGDAAGGDAQAAAVSGRVGSPCSHLRQCTALPQMECFQDVPGLVRWPGGFCSKSCRAVEGEPPVDCGADATCATGGSGGGMTSTSYAFCTTTCTQPEECRVAEGYRCQIMFPGLPGVCMPPL